MFTTRSIQIIRSDNLCIKEKIRISIVIVKNCGLSAGVVIMINRNRDTSKKLVSSQHCKLNIIKVNNFNHSYKVLN